MTFPDPSRHLLDGAVREVSEFANELGEGLGPAADRLLEILGDLASHAEQQIRVFAQYVGESSDLRLGGWRILPALDLAQEGRRYTHSPGDFPQRETGIVRAQRFSSLANVVTEVVHVLSVK